MEENCLSALHINRSFFSSLKSVIAFLLAPKIYRILNSQRNVKHGHLESAPRANLSAPVLQFPVHRCGALMHRCTTLDILVHFSVKKRF